MARKTAEQKAAETQLKKLERMEWHVAEIRKLEPNLQTYLKKIQAKFDLDKMAFTWVDPESQFQQWIPVKVDIEQMSEYDLEDYLDMLRKLRNANDAVIAIEEKAQRKAMLEKRLREMMTPEEASEFNVTVYAK